MRRTDQRHRKGEVGKQCGGGRERLLSFPRKDNLTSSNRVIATRSGRKGREGRGGGNGEADGKAIASSAQITGKRKKDSAIKGKRGEGRGARGNACATGFNTSVFLGGQRG